MLEVMQILHISYKINNKESQLFTSFLTQTPSVLITLSLAQLEHWLQLLGVDIFRSAENVRFWDALRSWKKNTLFVYFKSRELPSSWTCTILPKVTKPTRACLGIIDSDMIRLSLRLWSSSSCMQVSTTNKKTGPGIGRCWGSVYSIVVKCGISSHGRCCSVAPAYDCGNGFRLKQKLHAQIFAA